MSLQHTFIANLKKFRKLRGISQMTLAELCNMGGNYIGQIEMGRRIPSFEKIEKIAAVLEIPCHEFFVYEENEKTEEQKPKTKEYLQKMPHSVKKEIIASLVDTINKGIKASFDSDNY